MVAMASTRAQAPQRKRGRMAAAALLVATVVTIGAGEMLVRASGWQPWRTPDSGITVTPGGRFVMQHPVLGYTHIPGEYMVTLPSGYSFHVTHGPDTLRVTGPARTDDTRPEIWIFGCSFTHGWALNDEQTYPWLLQEKLPGYKVVNFGVSGYGTLHSLLQFRAALERGRPAVAVLAYASFHDARNTFLRQRRKETAPWNRLGPLGQPYARLNKDGGLRLAMTEVTYEEVPLMRYSAFAHFLESQYNRIEDYFFDSHKVSEALVSQMQELARSHDVRLVVAGIWPDAPTHDMLRFASNQGWPVVDLGVDVLAPGYSSMPHDPHPNALANQVYAARLLQYLQSGALVTR